MHESTATPAAQAILNRSHTATLGSSDIDEPSHAAQLQPRHRNTRRRTSDVTYLTTERKSRLVLAGVESLTINEHIDEIGFGAYQVHIFALCAGCLFTEGAMIMLFSSLVATWSDDAGQLRITTATGRSLVMTCLFAGIQIGTVTSGAIGDALGRRWPIGIQYVGILAGNMALATAMHYQPSVLLLYPLLVTIGFFAGLGIPTAFIMVTEVMPTRLRGLVGAAMGFAIRLGWLWTSIGLLIFKPSLRDVPWRWLLLWTSFPTGCLVAFGLVSPAVKRDTTHFLSVRSTGRATVSSLNVIAVMNRRPDLEVVLEEAIADEKSPNLSFSDVLQMMSTYPVWFYMAMCIPLMWSKEFVVTGSVVFWPMTFSHMKGIHSFSPAAKLMATILIGLPGIGIAMGIMHKMQRRQALSLGAFVTTLATLAMTYLEGSSGDGWILGVSGVFLFQLFFPTWQMVTFVLPTEVFPTQIKNWCYGIVYFIARFASELSPLVVEWSHAGFLVTSAIAAMIVAVLVYALPETKDKALIHFINDDESTKRPQASNYGAT